MPKQIPPIERAIVVQDQQTGAVRVRDDGEAAGLDLWCDPRPPASEDMRPLEIVLAVPASAWQLVTGGEGFAAGMEVVALTPAGELPAELTAYPKATDRPTALVSADRKLRGDAAQAGLYPAPHPALLPSMANGELPQAARIAGTHGQLVRWATST